MEQYLWAMLPSLANFYEQNWCYSPPEDVRGHVGTLSIHCTAAVGGVACLGQPPHKTISSPRILIIDMIAMRYGSYAFCRYPRAPAPSTRCALLKTGQFLFTHADLIKPT